MDLALPGMNCTRLSVLFLTIAAVAGAVGMGLPSALGLPGEWRIAGGWESALRALCVGALGAFLVTFLLTLDRSSLVKR